MAYDILWLIVVYSVAYDILWLAWALWFTTWGWGFARAGDIRPENIMVVTTAGGAAQRIVLLDLGRAAVSQDEEEHAHEQRLLASLFLPM